MEYKSQNVICQNCKGKFIIEPNDFGFYEKIGVPPPTFCPECRLQRRLLFRNERDYYKRECDLCGNSIIAVYPENYKTPVYCVKCWWSDKWDPVSYGREYDPNRPFFEQFKKLFYTVPMIAMQNDDGVRSINCQYTYDTSRCKNCYLVMCDWETENSLYSYHVCQSKDMCDSYYSNGCTLCYEVVTSSDCYHCSYLTLSVACNDCMLGFDLRGCSDCFMCVGLRNKKYCILNKQYSKEEYEKKKKEMQPDRRDKIQKYQKQLYEFSLKFPRRFAHIFKSVSTTGDCLWNCKVTHDSYYFKDLENCRFMLVGDGGKDTYDSLNTGKPNLSYNCVTPDLSYMCICNIYGDTNSNVEYSNNCQSCQYMLGCSGVKHGKYMILNKKYNKEEFDSLREKIKAQMIIDKSWGEFFPADMSPHAYNESSAQDWIPLTREQAIEKGFQWKEHESRNYNVTMPVDAIPQTILLVTDAILDETLGCRDAGKCEHKCSTAFRITSMELAFYRRMNLPLPDLCHNCRYYKRLARRNPPKLWHRKCMKEGCDNEFETSYAPDRPEIVYCEKCYQQEVY